WTPADLEVVVIEALAAGLDQLSDMADRVSAEAYLETARRPESVRRLLGFIGFDAATLARLHDDPPSQPGALRKEEKLDQLWTDDPTLMERARRGGAALGAQRAAHGHACGLYRGPGGASDRDARRRRQPLDRLLGHLANRRSAALA